MAYTHTNVANNPKALLHRLLPRNWLSIKLTTLHLILGRWWLCTAAIVLGTILVKAMNAICWWMKLTMAVISLLGRTLMCCNFLLFLSSSSPARRKGAGGIHLREHFGVVMQDFEFFLSFFLTLQAWKSWKDSIGKTWVLSRVSCSGGFFAKCLSFLSLKSWKFVLEEVDGLDGMDEAEKCGLCWADSSW